MNIAKEIRVKGIVQGVGFRPFIYNLALSRTISGYVFNDTLGVFILAEGSEDDVSKFIRDIKLKAPPLAYIYSVESSEAEVQGLSSFTIEKSRITEEKQAFYSPDVAVCPQCLSEFFDSDDRRFHYHFITCINCGPRFSIISDIPYDRPNTSMDTFPMCESCLTEYGSHTDRRFHTQPNACPKCGPIYTLSDMDGVNIAEDQSKVAESIIKLLKEGNVVAIKGIGGYHLAADAANDEAVKKLRTRKNRPFKPFALMAGDIDSIKKYAHVSPIEEDLLISKERPIVLLKEKNETISSYVAPGVSSLGFMLPYTPIQHLMFQSEDDLVLVMTSGNISNEPIVFGDNDVYKRLSGIADYVASYNRDILGQSDDSVLYVVGDRPFFIRRSRGYVPIPFSSNKSKIAMMAAGGDLKNSFAIAKNDFIILSQFLGDMADPLTFRVYRHTIDHFIKIFAAEPELIVADLHPGYLTTEYADELEEKGKKILKVQHHHAHIASVLEDRNVDEKVLGVAFDGTGYGPDGTLWGSEILIADRKNYTRAGHFSYFPLPGGENAIKDVWKIGLSLLYTSGVDYSSYWKDRPDRDMVVEIIEKGINSPATCSIGRLFDGVSAILGISDTISTEAEAAILLEEAAVKGDRSTPVFDIPFSEVDGVFVLDSGALVKYITGMMDKGKTLADVAFGFHQSIVSSTIKVLKKLRDKTGITTVAASGGVYHNRLILEMMMKGLEDEGFNLLVPHDVPFNDGCIALGQLAIAKAQ